MPGLFLLLFFAASCNGDPSGQGSMINAAGESAAPPKSVGAIPLPKGYQRIPAVAGSYTDYLRSIPLKPDKTVYLYNGTKKSNQQAQYAVIDMDAGTKDLQQCADAVMRIRAEFLYHQKAYRQISFRFTNGFICDFEHYAQGYRLKMAGNLCSWTKRAPEDYSYKTFRSYLDVVYAYAGTKSLHQQLHPIAPAMIRPGSVLLQTRDPYGHAVTIMDMAVHPQTHDTIFLISQSYMPAQDIHILVNPGHDNLSPWYSTRGGSEIRTPEWTFDRIDLMSF